MSPEAGGDLDWFMPMWFQMLERFFMGNMAVLREAIHPPFKFFIYVAIVYLVMEVVFLHKIFRYNSDGDADPVGLVCVGVEV